ncbi:MAG: 2-oxo-3-hexenedioate decarboxylase [Burkholderiaceae bacterium]|jgi:2-oxo-3-hexenedioate decarboxylase|nr:2-oxo-3-hexenedioate decarboxylase [Burkholderiaceae bacterium]
MTLTPELLANFTDRVETAQRTAQAMAKLTDDYPAMTVRDGYAVQFELRRRWLAQGQRQTGWKAGLTSRAKMKQMGIDVPSIGFLMASMYRPEGSAVETKDLLHPRVECEIAFVTRQPLSGADCGREQVLAATDFVVPAIEIIDSRYAGFKFDLPSVIADNGSSARYVTGGQPHDPKALELDTIGVVFEKNGETVGLGTSAAVMGHPADAVVLLVKVLHELGETLPAGSLVLSGGITEAVAVKPGDAVLARYQGMGSVAIRFV